MTWVRKGVYTSYTSDFVSLEGFLVTKIFVAGLKRTPRKVTRENLIDAIESMHKLDIGIDEIISYNKNEHQALHRICATQIKMDTL